MGIKFKRLWDHRLPLPFRGSEFSAGLDLHAASNVEIHPQSRELVSTGFAVHIPNGYYGRIASRSGLACRSGIVALAGVIDSDYRGEIRVLLYNLSDKTYSIELGDRVAQIIFEACLMNDAIEVSTLPETTRGQNSFGSTGKR